MSLRLQARKLACERDGRWLFRDLDLEIRSGEILRVEGPNGSGKTTLLKILSGQLADYEGSIFWRDAPLRRVHRNFLASLLYLGHAPGVKAALTPLENLAWYQAMAGTGGTEAQRMSALEMVGLRGFEDLPAGQLSAGQQRRVALARLELTPRPLWVLDEPFTAIDREGVADLEARLAAHVRGGGSVVLTTHQALDIPVPMCRVRLGEGKGNVAS
ncbi:cytochrome c biogenesis heme-transporting ATPase CcmA [Halomonas eurihalina]|uniref:Cytochrome c biogenesis heme-transporting ATPase CcmA n=1 Tax=Halomonas eurihalina TaxID=42566 RepID=A0A5D9D829_HALER|nr:cytochrome c biogenesis heme-transporting ATPase CcmA [Halomonas eurihalina]MDR5858959.1 cytochrome c biogenesis heme-transporting ATPase CcmA [Halomonas eurihalina]TZG39462.1 cytochrome c biogenesis heme-transporting ATPase CcmA [Halomonas eurihalina]